MMDWNRHEAEIESAHRTRLADGALEAARRRRQRRRGLTGAGALAVAAAVLVPLLTVDAGPRVIAGQPRADSVDASPPPTRGPDIADIYLDVLGGPRVSSSHEVRVLDRECADVPSRPTVDCQGPPIPARVQARVVAEVGSHLRFVASVEWPTDIGQPAIVGFGPLHVSGTSATLGVESVCGPLCGSGDRRTFAVRDGRWVQVGSEPTWIS